MKKRKKEVDVGVYTRFSLGFRSRQGGVFELKTCLVSWPADLHFGDRPGLDNSRILNKQVT